VLEKYTYGSKEKTAARETKTGGAGKDSPRELLETK
jgi:hypothetical protein